MSSTNQNKKNEVFLQNDPVYKLVSRFSVIGVWFIVALVHVVIYVIVGVSIDFLYPDPGHSFLLGIHDSAEIMNGINVWLVFVPTIWAYYRWFPSKTIALFQEIELDGIVPNGPESLLTLLKRQLDLKWIYFLALLATLISFFYLWLVFVPMQYEKMKLIDFWYYTLPTSIIFSVLYVLANYVTFIFVLRVLITVITLRQYFSQPNSITCLIPLHPDKCGGLGNIGLLVNRTTILVVVFITWSIIVTFVTQFAGGVAQFTSIFIVYTIYILVIPVILIIPIWQPHAAMLSYKNNRLKEISQKMLEVDGQLANEMAESNLDQLKSKHEYYKFLQERYVLLEKQIPVWPISLPELRNLGAVASSPIVVALVTIGLTWALSYFDNTKLK